MGNQVKGGGGGSFTCEQSCCMYLRAGTWELSQQRRTGPFTRRCRPETGLCSTLDFQRAALHCKEPGAMSKRATPEAQRAGERMKRPWAARWVGTCRVPMRGAAHLLANCESPLSCACCICSHALRRSCRHARAQVTICGCQWDGAPARQVRKLIKHSLFGPCGLSPRLSAQRSRTRG